jgi:hypothetical protein
MQQKLHNPSHVNSYRKQTCTGTCFAVGAAANDIAGTSAI